MQTMTTSHCAFVGVTHATSQLTTIHGCCLRIASHHWRRCRSPNAQSSTPANTRHKQHACHCSGEHQWLIRTLVPPVRPCTMCWSPRWIDHMSTHTRPPSETMHNVLVSPMDRSHEYAHCPPSETMHNVWSPRWIDHMSTHTRPPSETMHNGCCSLCNWFEHTQPDDALQ